MVTVKTIQTEKTRQRRCRRKTWWDCVQDDMVSACTVRTLRIRTTGAGESEEQLANTDLPRN